MNNLCSRFELVVIYLWASLLVSCGQGNDSKYLKNVSAISAGGLSACAIADSSAFCWGRNTSGQLGNASIVDTAAAVSVSTLDSGVSSIAVGDTFACAVVSGAVKCWGDNSYGQLGTNNNSNSTVPVQVTGLTSDYTAVAAGSFHACALSSSGSVRCWGTNAKGQLGNSTTTTSLTPVVAVASGATAISARAMSTCAVVSGAAKCWGYNGTNQLGDGTTVNKTSPTTVSGLSTGVTGISMGGYTISGGSTAFGQSCAVYTSSTTSIKGYLSCWGYNANGQLGTSNTTNSSTPVSLYTSNMSAAAPGSGSTCALDLDGLVRCWGNNDSGQLGDGSTTSNTSGLTNVSGLTTGVSSIAAGGMNPSNGFACAQTTDNQALCWGNNSNGQLGNNTLQNSSFPVYVLRDSLL